MIKTYIIGNWKMNFTVGESSIFLHKLQTKIHPSRSVQVVVAPSLIALQPLSLQVDRRKLKLSAQNFYYKDFGAYTGEVSIAQLKSLVDFSIIGHSERRHILGETDKDICEKVASALRSKVTPILCIGETAEERKNGETADVIRDQIYSGLKNVSKEEIKDVIVAYEPVWAISSTKNATPATPDKIQEVIDLVRKTLESTFGKDAKETPVLFGGSVKSTNARAYLEIEGVNGLLIGGASLIAPEFLDIIETAKNLGDER